MYYNQFAKKILYQTDLIMTVDQEMF